ncbi:MAG: cytochrome P460 family protein [Pseudomonadota bacterium]
MKLTANPQVVAAILISLVSLSHATNAIAQDADKEPTGSHLAIEDPAKLSGDELNSVYEQLKERMASGYAISGKQEIRNYQRWQIFNSQPYLSATHGRRYINSYANRLGRDYGEVGEGESYPEGSIFAKDSITVTKEGKVFPGALFVMEKLKPGTSETTADWRYFMINPDGSMSGDTLGDDPEEVQYCHECHEGVADSDYVFFVPKKYRLK